MMLSKKILFLSIIALVAGCSDKRANGQELPPPPSAKARISFEKQWSVFQELGFVLNPGIDNDVVEKLRKDKLIEDKPYFNLYIELGSTIQKEPWTPLTDRVWDFDLEAVEDHGDYVVIMKNLERISGGEIRFEKLKDYVDIEAGVAWVSFSIRGRAYKWHLKQEDDWADPELLTKIVELTRTLGTKGRYTYFNTGGQDAVIGYETPESRAAIAKATGLKIEWLN